jgi:hypothetical protein
MRNKAWNQRFQELSTLKLRTGSTRVDPYHHSESLRDWLEHQKALLALGGFFRFTCGCTSCMCTSFSVCVAVHLPVFTKVIV